MNRSTRSIQADITVFAIAAAGGKPDDTDSVTEWIDNRRRK